jgi:hypothetical protein
MLMMVLRREDMTFRNSDFVTAPGAPINSGVNRHIAWRVGFVEIGMRRLLEVG